MGSILLMIVLPVRGTGKMGRKWEKFHERAQVVKILTWVVLLWCGRRDLLPVLPADVS